MSNSWFWIFIAFSCLILALIGQSQQRPAWVTPTRETLKVLNEPPRHPSRSQIPQRPTYKYQKERVRELKQLKLQDIPVPETKPMPLNTEQATVILQELVAQDEKSKKEFVFDEDKETKESKHDDPIGETNTRLKKHQKVTEMLESYWDGEANQEAVIELARTLIYTRDLKNWDLSTLLLGSVPNPQSYQLLGAMANHSPPGPTADYIEIYLSDYEQIKNLRYILPLLSPQTEKAIQLRALQTIRNHLEKTDSAKLIAENPEALRVYSELSYRLLILTQRSTEHRQIAMESRQIAQSILKIIR